MIIPPTTNIFLYYGFLGMTVLMFLVLFYLLKKNHPVWKVLLGLGLAVGVPAVLSISGYLARIDLLPPPSMLLPIYVLTASCVFSFSKAGKRLMTNYSLGVLIAIQSMRVPVEYLLHHGAEAGIVPKMLSITGWNYDLITGLGAVLISVPLLLGKKVSLSIIWLWNLVGIICLAVIFFIAITSSPVLKVWGEDPSVINTWVLFWPYTLLPMFLVVIALSGHIIITRKLLDSAGIK